MIREFSVFCQRTFGLGTENRQLTPPIPLTPFWVMIIIFYPINGFYSQWLATLFYKIYLDTLSFILQGGSFPVESQRFYFLGNIVWLIDKEKLH